MFTLYNVLKFVHICAVIVWVGGVIALVVVNARLVREEEDAALQALSRQGEFFGKTLIGPSAILTLLVGAALVWEMHTGFPLWVAWGLVGVFGSMAIGAGFMQRAGRELAELSAAGEGQGEGKPDAARVAAARQRLARLGALNILLLLSTVWAMVFKPTLW